MLLARLKTAQQPFSPHLSSLIARQQQQQQRGKKWACKHTSGVSGTAEQRAATYEKRLRRRSSNQGLRSWLTGGNASPDAWHFQGRWKKGRPGSEEGRWHTPGKNPGKRQTRGKPEWEDKRKRKPWASDGQSRQRQQGYSQWEEEILRQWTSTHEAFKRGCNNAEWPFREGSHSQQRESQHFRYEQAWMNFGFRFPFGRQRASWQSTDWSYSHRSPNQSPPEDATVKKHLSNLGLHSAAGLTGEVLKKSFHRCALVWHPDKHCGSEDGRTQAEEKFKSIKSSYHFLQTCIDS